MPADSLGAGGTFRYTPGMNGMPPTSAPCGDFHATDGRLELRLRLLGQGRDLHAFLLGGEPHVGATALAAPGEPAQICERAAHREGPLAGLVARRLADAFGCAVSVSAGIHFPDITRAEIAAVERMAAGLAEQCISSFEHKEQRNMLSMQELDALESYIRSGQLEKDFQDGCEHDRHYLLELLEKLMDVAELADEAATRLIYRGLNPGLTPPRKAQEADSGQKS